jgi:hypothetical protein
MELESPASSFCLRFELSRLPLKLPLAILKVTPATPVFVEPHDPGEIGLGQPLELLFKAGLPTSESLLARLEFLRQPLPAMRPSQGVRDLLWMAQQVTEIAPDQLVQAPGRAQPRRALLLPMYRHQLFGHRVGLRGGKFRLWPSVLRAGCHRARSGQARAAGAVACGRDGRMVRLRSNRRMNGHLTGEHWRARYASGLK